LAHTNVPGSGEHAKRWEDVLSLLEAGIAVITTVNIQHLESLADAVEKITGITVRERVPDWVVHRADQIELIDSSPEQLRRRMLHGNIYPTPKVPDALSHFFRTENLVALRELALRFLADETEEDLLDYLRYAHPDAVWDTTERILVAITSSPGIDGVLRRAARIATRVKGDLHAVHVTSGDAIAGEGGESIQSVHRLAHDLGAEWHDATGDDAAKAIVEIARRLQITQIVLGSERRSRWQEVTGASFLRSVLRRAAIDEIDVHVIARGVPAPDAASSPSRPGGRPED